MSDNKPQRLSKIVEQYAPQGANDWAWAVVEHQLEQARMSVETVLSHLSEIWSNPESAHECLLAKDCYDILRGLRVDVLEKRAKLLSYLSGTDVPERVSRKKM